MKRADHAYIFVMQDFKSLLQMMYKACAHYMNQQVHLLVATPDWNLLSEQLQNDIKEGKFTFHSINSDCLLHNRLVHIIITYI